MKAESIPVSKLSDLDVTGNPSRYYVPIGDTNGRYESRRLVIADIDGLQSALDGKLTQTAGDARYSQLDHTHTFASLTSKPTTISSYGITDAYTKTESDGRYSALGHTHAFIDLTGKPTSISGYGITDAYTKTEGDARYAPLSHNQAWSTITSTPTTIAGYGITDFNSLGDARWAQLGAANTFTQAQLINSSTNLNNLTLTNTTGCGLRLNSSNANAATRNFAIGTNVLAFGDWQFYRSATQGGNPFSGSALMSFNASGQMGVNTTSPFSQLDVLGTLNLSGTSDSPAHRQQFEIVPSFPTSTDASRKARAVFNVYDTAAREAIRIEASGTAAMLGFYGASAVAKQTVSGSRGSNAALADLLNKLATLGLITDGTS